MEQYLLTLVEEALRKYLYLFAKNSELLAAMEYSLFSGGKRIRPLLTLKFCEICGESLKKALPFACAVEMIHTFSLIHDDLPCMDDDDFRRGKPTCHKAFGEAVALLAGDALLNLAYEILFSDEALNSVKLEKIVQIAKIMSQSCSATGMINGQALDIQNKSLNLEVLNKMYTQKTANIIMAAAQIGCIVADAPKEKVKAAKNYAQCLGIAFQIRDDILDLEEDKVNVNKFNEVFCEKSTYISTLGLEKTKKILKDLTTKAVKKLKIFGENATELQKFTLSLAKRHN